MKFIFWQNVVSIHQSAFIKALAENHDVTLVAQEEIDAERTKEKWTVPDMGKADVLLSPDDCTIESLLDNIGSEHVFSGINAYPMVYKAFKGAVKRGLEVTVMMEPYKWAGIKGLMRQFMYRSLFFRYGKHIKHIFATGDMGVECYRKSGCPNAKLHQWGYFTECLNNGPVVVDQRTRPNLIFIGKIDERKNILALVRSALSLQCKFNHFTIIGTGLLEPELRKMIAGTSNIEFIGTVANSEISRYLRGSDLLVLPSLFDGWGAVVNEALSQGVRVLCSDRCGAASLLDGEDRGGIFKLSVDSDLTEKLECWLSRGILNADERNRISSWASKYLSGTSVASYFSNIMSGKMQDIPWINNKGQ